MKITLKEARELADSAKENAYQSLLQHCYDEIRKCASEGHYKCIVEYDECHEIDLGSLIAARLGGEEFEVSAVRNEASSGGRLEIKWTRPKNGRG